MASALIPEVIEPGDLYVLDTFNQFSVDSATAPCPNTDPCLLLSGSAGQFKAYQPAISGIHYPAAVTDPFSILYWFREGYGFSTPSSPGTSYCSRALMGVTDVYAGATNASGSGLASTQGFRWLITYAGLTDADVSGINFQRAIQASTREWAGADDLAGVADTWVGVAVRSPGAPFAPSVYTFDVVNKTIISSGHVAGTPGAVGSPYFSIGAFPWTSGWGTGPQDVRIAKISLFNRMVTDVEIAELNDAMMFGPPSP